MDPERMILIDMCQRLEVQNRELLTAVEPLLAEFGARLSDGKPLGYTVGSMRRALDMVRVAEAAIAKAKEG